jgi:hypothetical protein
MAGPTLVVRPSVPLERSVTREHGGFIAGRVYDGVCFILAPLVALLFVELASRSTWAMQPGSMFGVEDRPLALFLSVWTFAHLFAVVFRSHANEDIFAQHRFRFVAVPVLLFLAMVVSDWAMVTGVVLIVFWDVYHTSMQNFGLCRIYDGRLGNPAQTGRLLDVWLNHLIYIGPILAGASLLPTLATLQSFKEVGWKQPTHWIAAAAAWQPTVRWIVIVSGAAFVGFYAWWYACRVREGYRFSPQKLALLLSVASVSILAWGFMTPWKAFFVANFFHGLQYFAIVWWIEKKNIARVLPVPAVRSSALATFLAFAAVLTVVGVAYRVWGDHHVLRWGGALAAVISLMHFWYDGFVWSVRKREV